MHNQENSLEGGRERNKVKEKEINVQKDKKTRTEKRGMKRKRVSGDKKEIGDWHRAQKLQPKVALELGEGKRKTVIYYLQTNFG